ncbi:MAG: crotonase/enoyl-CoA hydratase family protein [Rhodospirillales bacterium]|nr:crotonase/enoyl-CoA hydratase family protein [Rhodospirillales bacterium]
MPTENEATARHFGGATTDRVTPVTALQIGQLARDQFAFEACSTLTEWSLNELDVVFEPPAGIIWQYMRPRARPSFTHGLLRDLNAVADGIEGAFSRSTSDEEPPARFVVSASRVPGIFNLGGDLSLFLRLIETRDRDGLRRYAHSCARGQYRLHSSYDSPVTLVALVQGDALGGGFEAILAHDIVVAERQSQFGLPEVLFNLFPGMGAYSFLSRRLGAVQAEKMILSGKVYSAEDLHEMGIVDHLAETGQGEEATYDLIAEFNRSRHARQAVLRTRKIVNKVTVEELIDVADVWVDTALQLGSNDLRRMAHLARAQDRRWSRIEPSTRLSA